MLQTGASLRSCAKNWNGSALNCGSRISACGTVLIHASSDRSVGIKQFSCRLFISDEDIEEPALERCLERRELILPGGNYHGFSGMHHPSDFFGTERGKDRSEERRVGK